MHDAPLLPIDDLLTPFMLEGGRVRGRIVRLGAVTQTVLSHYDYPPPVAHLLGELLVVAAMLSAKLKQDGIFTIQIRGKGLVPLIVVDGTYGGMLRGYAEVSPAAAEAIHALPNPSVQAMVGADAYLAITLDPGRNLQRYQGIVGLEGDSVAAVIVNYFTHSEQMDAHLQLSVRRGTQWEAAGLMIERMPDEGNAAPKGEDWRYALAVAGTVSDAELFDPLLDAQTLLYRLFHEQGVWVYEPQKLHVGCRCSRERIRVMLMGMAPTERADMVVDGKVSVHCQFCNKSEIFRPDDLGLSAAN